MADLTENKIEYPVKTEFFLLYNISGDDPYSYGQVNTDQCMKSGLKVLETFDTQAALYTRMDELGYSHNE